MKPTSDIVKLRKKLRRKAIKRECWVCEAERQEQQGHGVFSDTLEKTCSWTEQQLLSLFHFKNKGLALLNAVRPPPCPLIFKHTWITYLIHQLQPSGELTQHPYSPPVISHDSPLGPASVSRKLWSGLLHVPPCTQTHTLSPCPHLFCSLIGP